MTPTMQTLINEHLSLTCFATLQPRKRNSSQGSGGVDRRAGSSGHYRGGGAIKPCLPSLSLPQGPLVLPIKPWESHGCNEVSGTKVAITVQLNCHRCLNGSTSPKCSLGCKYLQIRREPERISQCAVASWWQQGRIAPAVRSVVRWKLSQLTFKVQTSEAKTPHHRWTRQHSATAVNLREQTFWNSVSFDLAMKFAI